MSDLSEPELTRTRIFISLNINTPPSPEKKEKEEKKKDGTIITSVLNTKKKFEGTRFKLQIKRLVNSTIFAQKCMKAGIKILAGESFKVKP